CGTSRLKIVPYAFAPILRAPPDSAPCAGRGTAHRGGRPLPLQGRNVAPPKVSSLAAAGLVHRTSADFVALLRFSTYAAPSAATSPSLTPQNTLLPQCKIIRDKERTKKHQALSDRPKNYFRYSR